MYEELNGKNALVTGASKGIGKAIALELAKHGCNVAVNYNTSKDNALKVCEEIRKLGSEAMEIKADISKKDDIIGMFNAVKAKFRSLDILINNAGITKDRTLRNMTDEEWHNVIDTNLNSIFHCCKAAIDMMNDSGSIVNISSIVALTGNFGQTNYSAAKSGIIGFTKSLAKELGKRKITVNAIAPGFIETEMTDKVSFIKKRMIQMMIPSGKFGKPEDIAYAASFLCSNNARYITGQVIRVDGGLGF